MQNDKMEQSTIEQVDNIDIDSEKFYIAHGYRKVNISDVYFPMVILLPDIMKQDKRENNLSLFCLISADDLALLNSFHVKYVWVLNKDIIPEKPKKPVISPIIENKQSPAEDIKAMNINTVEEKYVPLSVELAECKNFFQQSYKQIRFCLDSIREKGILPMEEVANIVDNITASVARNPNTLLCMRGLQSADKYTYFHSINVSLLASIFAKFLGYSTKEVWRIGFAGILHDIGKQKIPLQILHAARKLTEKEFEIMKIHPQLACDILNNGHGLSEGVMEGIYRHHEKFDGSGYPDGLKGDKIHPYAVILAMTDVYDALTSARPYKRAFNPTRAIAIIYAQKNTSFSPEMVTQFINCFGLYPVGSLVRLNNNNLAIVYENNDNDLRKPKVLQLPLLLDNILTSNIKSIDLSTAKDTLHIVRCEDADAHDFNLQELILNNIKFF